MAGSHARVATYPDSNGRSFYMVHCNTCDTILNNGHHYSNHSVAFAELLAELHNDMHAEAERERVLTDIAAALPSGEVQP